MKDEGVSVNASNDRMTWEQDKSNTTLTWPSPKPLGAATSQIIGLHHLLGSLILYPQFARCLTAADYEYSKRVHIHLHVLEEI